MSLARHLYPKTCMKDDVVIRAAEIAEEFFIIKKGSVEVLATDGKTLISNFIIFFKK